MDNKSDDGKMSIEQYVKELRMKLNDDQLDGILRGLAAVKSLFPGANESAKSMNIPPMMIVDAIISDIGCALLDELEARRKEKGDDQAA
jgi:hypothetical protein